MAKNRSKVSRQAPNPQIDCVADLVLAVVVRRMLEDKYKPLRVPQSEKQLQQADQPYDSPSSHVMLLPGTSATPRDRGPHQPW